MRDILGQKAGEAGFMISEKEAFGIVRKNIPDGEIRKIIEHEDWYAFIVHRLASCKGQTDLLCSVHRSSGDFCDFPYLDKSYFRDMRELETYLDMVISMSPL